MHRDAAGQVADRSGKVTPQGARVAHDRCTAPKYVISTRVSGVCEDGAGEPPVDSPRHPAATINTPTARPV